MRISFVLILLSSLGISFSSVKADGLKSTQEKKTVLITGGSSGLGLQLTKKYLEQHYFVIVLARTPIEPALIQTGQVDFISTDLTQPESLQSSLQAVKSRYPHLDLLIHNAGLTVVRPTRELTTVDIDRSIKINYTSPATITSQLIDHAVENQHPLSIIYVSSLGAILHHPEFSAYAASKRGAEVFFESLHSEIRSDPSLKNLIQVQVARPGFIQSDYPVQVDSRSEATTEFMSQLREFSPTSSSDVVQAIYQMSARPQISEWQRTMIHNIGIETQLLVMADRWLPQWFQEQSQKVVQSVIGAIAARPICKRAVHTTIQNQKMIQKGLGKAIKGIGLIGSLFALNEYLKTFNLDVAETEELMKFFFEFRSAMIERSEIVTQNPDQVFTILSEAHQLMRYQSESIPIACNKTFTGKMTMNGNFLTYLLHWHQLLMDHFGSVNDRMYTDIVDRFVKDISHQQKLKSNLTKIKVYSTDEYTAQMLDGVMVWMREEIEVRQFGIEVNRNFWDYHRVRSPVGHNSFEKSILQQGCDAEAVQKFYRERFNPRHVIPGMEFFFDFTVQEVNLDQKGSQNNSKVSEFSHHFDFLGPH